MTNLTRRLFQENHYQRWDIFDGDVCVGSLTKVNGTGCSVLWQWACGFYPGCDVKTQLTSGNQETYEEGKAAFQEAWERLRPQITPEMRQEWLRHRAFTNWKYAMHDANCRMPTAVTSGVSRCFCGVQISIADADEHIYTAHMVDAACESTRTSAAVYMPIG